MMIDKEIIDGTSDFILSANQWSSQAVMFVSVIIIALVVFINAYLLIKNINKNQDKLSEVVDKNSHGFMKLSTSIDLQNRTNLETLNKLDKGINESLEMHKITHNDLNDLKKIVLSKRFSDDGMRRTEEG